MKDVLVLTLALAAAAKIIAAGGPKTWVRLVLSDVSEAHRRQQNGAAADE